ncbi:MAG: undecaprenyldiphospho-muramoylpentapeptide beta-N-acetylglucosaminyltransferase [Actinomycetaceae bacterium]|nr:undecaprenyldiphospho-muramoylpentapeptide beta-N-acetylglucosaminyltransferase [Actinomycetaceae bacterium]
MASINAGARVLLAGGGSAGHVNPLIAVASVLRERGIEVQALGTAQGLEKDLVPAAGLTLHTIKKVPAPRRPNKAALTFARDLRRTIHEVERLIKKNGIEAIVGFGGYVSAPAYLAARAKGIPVIIHEQNVRAGLANKLGARFAAVLALTFEQTALEAKKGVTEVTGLPLRASIAELASDRSSEAGRNERRVEAAQKLGIDPNKTTLLITGGSLGAKHLNDVMVSAAGSFGDDIQVLHLTGKGKREGVDEAVRASGFKGTWIAREYASDMENYLASADLVVARSGAGMVAELTALGLPAVYVPLPIGNGEQKLNASRQVEAGGALLFPDADFSEKIVADYVVPLLNSKERLASMAEKSAQLGITDAAKRVSDLVESVLAGVRGGLR